MIIPTFILSGVAFILIIIEMITKVTDTDSFIQFKKAEKTNLPDYEKYKYVSIFKDGELIKHGVISLTDEEIGLRLNKLRDRLSILIANYDINEVIFEDIYMAGETIHSIPTFKILAEVFGICEELCTDLNIKHQAVIAKVWKSTSNIKGKTRAEQKKNTQQYVKDKFNLKVSEDVSDAICIGMHALACKKQETNKLQW